MRVCWWFNKHPTHPRQHRILLIQGADINSYGHTMWTALVSQSGSLPVLCGQIKYRKRKKGMQGYGDE